MYLSYAEFLDMGGTTFNMSESEYLKHERHAENYLNRLTHGRVKNESPVRENVKSAIFDLIPLFKREEEYAPTVGSGITSMSSDNSLSQEYESYKAVSLIMECAKTDVCALYLTDETIVINGRPVPLLYAG